ncbi:MAG: hypothetical protein IPL52_08655 [Flavobacteriales bacterium]|nr:hypothetical protein [Flavobacteriales bacterium]
MKCALMLVVIGAMNPGRSLAQIDDQSLFTFDTLSYLMTARSTGGQMALTLEKYGAVFEQAQAGLRSINDRIDSGLYRSDALERMDSSAMRTVKELLGHYDGIDMEKYKQLHAAVAKADTAKGNALIRELVTTVSERIRALEAEVTALKELHKKPKWDILKEQCKKKPEERTADYLKPLTDQEAKEAGTRCADTLGLIAVIEKFTTARQKQVEKLKAAKARLESGTTDMVKGYAAAVAKRIGEIEACYAAARDVWEELRKGCTGDEPDCKAKRKELEKKARAILAERIKKVKREFNVRSPIGDYPEFFKAAFADELMGLSQAKPEKRSEAERGPRATLWRLISSCGRANTAGR